MRISRIYRVRTFSVAHESLHRDHFVTGVLTASYSTRLHEFFREPWFRGAQLLERDLGDSVEAALGLRKDFSFDGGAVRYPYPDTRVRFAKTSYPL